MEMRTRPGHQIQVQGEFIFCRLAAKGVALRSAEDKVFVRQGFEPFANPGKSKAVFRAVVFAGPVRAIHGLSGTDCVFGFILAGFLTVFGGRVNAAFVRHHGGEGNTGQPKVLGVDFFRRRDGQRQSLFRVGARSNGLVKRSLRRGLVVLKGPPACRAPS